ncbi:CoA-disulfide reductase [Arthrospiribacter ruber]|uniref:CoA-disulfide reductase n=1 Tax=Arthrospiribacter ruber TaxID=2487934 RepID=A0A951J0G6_9BACT|nr:CoA-disulfide reductase [Arthrospiribacter ruber]MBW3469714.1 CoA-disulfide reductase [Arthrospiribacter ruber]
MPDCKVIIIGGDAAGMSAASKIRRVHKNWKITVYERSPHTSYSACGMPYFISGKVDSSEKLIARDPKTFAEEYDIQAKVFHEVIQIDPGKQKVLVKNLKTNKSQWDTYDKLLIATGANPHKPDLPEVDSKGVFCLSTLQSGIDVFEFIEKNKPQKASIIGGGYLGVEMAEALLELDMEVTLFDRNEYIMKTLDTDMSEDICSKMTEAGVRLKLDENLTTIEADSDGYVNKIKTDKSSYATDLVILGMGVSPNSQLAQLSGIKLCDTAAIQINSKMETSHPNIWAAGDCASSYHLLKEVHQFIALGTIANKHGLVAGSNMAGEEMEFRGVLGTAITKFQDLEIARTGLSEREAKEADIPYETATIKSSNFAGYYPDSGDIKVKLIIDKKSRHIIGGQIIGNKGSGKRIDVIASAIMGKMTAFDLAMMDLAYVPPLSTVWDPVQIAARRLI